MTCKSPVVGRGRSQSDKGRLAFGDRSAGRPPTIQMRTEALPQRASHIPRDQEKLQRRGPPRHEVSFCSEGRHQSFTPPQPLKPAPEWQFRKLRPS
jgi:hypothetical protein